MIFLNKKEFLVLKDKIPRLHEEKSGIELSVAGFCCCTCLRDGLFNYVMIFGFLKQKIKDGRIPFDCIVHLT